MPTRSRIRWARCESLLGVENRYNFQNFATLLGVEGAGGLRAGPAGVPTSFYRPARVHRFPRRGGDGGAARSWSRTAREPTGAERPTDSRAPRAPAPQLDAGPRSVRASPG